MTEEELRNMVAERNGRIALLLSENERLKAIILGNENELTEKDNQIKDLEWQLKEVTEDNDYYQKDNIEKDKQIEELKKQLEHRHEVELVLHEMNKKRIEFEAQIEKMKADITKLCKDKMNDDIDQNIIERLRDSWLKE